jgi:hypothetical protein
MITQKKVAERSLKNAPMRYTAAIAIVLTLISTACYTDSRETRFGKRETVFAPREEPIDQAVPTVAISETTDIHFSAKYCKECHVRIPRKGSPASLRFNGDLQILCRCHYNSLQNYPHPVDITPSAELKPRIPAELPLQNGEVTCRTCHDVFIQCHDKPPEKILLKEQKFLRGAPYEDITAMCFKCHDINQYRRYNPHKQLNAQKQIEERKCLYCHSDIPDENRTTYEDIKLLGDMQIICVRCHAKETKKEFHAKHLRKPSPEVLKSIEQLRNDQHIILPLSQDGRVTCATCHNPHEKGVIPDRREGASGAGEKKRHRLTDKMCIKCHPMR